MIGLLGELNDDTDENRVHSKKGRVNIIGIPNEPLYVRFDAYDVKRAAPHYFSFGINSMRSSVCSMV